MKACGIDFLSLLETLCYRDMEDILMVTKASSAADVILL